MHLEGALEPELALAFARRNAIRLRARTAEELRASYRFTSLQAFLDVYYELAATLVTEDDFCDLTRAYLDRARRDNVRHAEVFFEPADAPRPRRRLRHRRHGYPGVLLEAGRRDHGLGFVTLSCASSATWVRTLPWPPSSGAAVQALASSPSGSIPPSSAIRRRSSRACSPVLEARASGSSRMPARRGRRVRARSTRRPRRRADRSRRARARRSRPCRPPRTRAGSFHGLPSLEPAARRRSVRWRRTD